MAQPRVLVLRAPGANCDRESQYAFELAGAAAERVHVNRLIESPRLLDEFQVLFLPGGFSYGDDIAAGRILASQLQMHLRDAVARFHDSDRLVLGVCNGFQALMRTGILFTPGNGATPPATLTYNDSGRLEDRWVQLTSSPGVDCVFLRGLAGMYLPVAHGEGKVVFRDSQARAELEASGQLVLRYARLDGQAGPVPFPDNPNGSEFNVAGICDTSGRILGLMPHPERHVDATQHPQWTRRGLAREGEGLALFRNAVEYFR
jgi:phosphoribosylformylglycinamidine synthase